jgi:acetyl esterase
MIDEEARAFLEKMAASGQPLINELAPPEARAMVDEIASQLGGPLEEVAEVRELEIPGPAGTIPARMYVPGRTKPFPILVYFHGGGWVVGSLNGWDSVMRTLTNASGCIVVSVDYRLAPEHKFPAAVDDAYAATKWIAENAASLGADPARLAVGGDSAGGNLAAVVTQLARGHSGPKIAFALLIYPAVDYDFLRASYAAYGEDHFLTMDMIRWFLGHYLTPEAENSTLLRPIKAAPLRELPPTHIICAECDPLYDEGAAYANRLEAEGVPVTFVRYEGTIHGFFTFPAALTKGRDAIADAGAALAAALGAKPVATGAARAAS